MRLGQRQVGRADTLSLPDDHPGMALCLENEDCAAKRERFADDAERCGNRLFDGFEPREQLADLIEVL